MLEVPLIGQRYGTPIRARKTIIVTHNARFAILLG
jgi:hypothetical protein